MPVLKDFRLTKSITLKEHEGSEIVVFNSILAGDGESLIALEDNPKSTKLLIELLPKFIKSWNFTDPQEQPLPINAKSLNLLKLDDIAEIVTQIKDFAESLKKK